jgi:hypothetical protein
MRFKTFLSIGVILLCSSILALAALDLRFTTAITQAPDPASGGATVTFSVAFKTFGGAVTNMKITGGVDGVQIFERTYASILADKTKTDAFTWTATAGAHTAWFELDPDHTCGDSDYGNNRVEKALTVGGGPAGQPDLAPVVTYTPTDFAAGAAVAFSIRVNNNGAAASNACQMTVKKGGATVQTINVAAIPAGNHLDKSYAWTAECDAVIEIKVDSNNANTESNEGNNTWSHTMACGDTGGGSGPIVFCVKCWLKYKLIEFEPFPKPDPCGGCPPWHDIFHRGDPIDILNGIGDKLGQGLGFDGVKGDWEKFLGNSHGLTPNGALKIIFDRAVLGAKGRLQTEGAIGKFQNSLNSELLLMHGFAKNKFANELQIQ